jgi:hypothetical protein
MDRRVIVRSEVKGLRSEAEAKASANCAIQFRAIDPKASDLSLARLKRM